MIFGFLIRGHAIPLDTDFLPSVVGVNQTFPTSRQSHARKLARAKKYLWKHGIEQWSKWKGLPGR